MEYTITFTWDEEADVWIATSNDIPGLVLESGSFDALLERTRLTIPDLLFLNASELRPESCDPWNLDHRKIPLNETARCLERVVGRE